VVVKVEIMSQYIQLTNETNNRSIESKKPGVTNLFIDNDTGMHFREFLPFISYVLIV
jgi:hypothetical protein